MISFILWNNGYFLNIKNQIISFISMWLYVPSSFFFFLRKQNLHRYLGLCFIIRLLAILYIQEVAMTAQQYFTISWKMELKMSIFWYYGAQNIWNPRKWGPSESSWDNHTLKSVHGFLKKKLHQNQLSFSLSINFFRFLHIKFYI